MRRLILYTQCLLAREVVSFVFTGDYPQSILKKHIYKLAS